MSEGDLLEQWTKIFPIVMYEVWPEYKNGEKSNHWEKNVWEHVGRCWTHWATKSNEPEIECTAVLLEKRDTYWEAQLRGGLIHVFTGDTAEHDAKFWAETVAKLEGYDVRPIVLNSVHIKAWLMIYKV